jgi:hypothetical protein
MYEDFDHLVDIVKKYNPQLNIRKVVCNYDVMTMLQQQREYIDTIKKTCDFFGLLEETVNGMIDMHAYMVNRRNAGMAKLFNKYSFLMPLDTSKWNLSRMEHAQYEKYKSPIFSFGNYMDYYNGRYYTIPNIIMRDRHGKKIKIGHCELLKIGKKTPEQYWIDHLKKHKGMITRWDYQHHCFYASELIFSRYDTLYLRDLKNDNMITLPLNEIIGVSFAYPRKFYLTVKNMETASRPVVHYFQREQLLYIYIPVMSHGLDTTIISMIEKKTCGKSLQKVVFDVRDNPGGSDYVWTNLLTKIAADTIALPSHISIRYEAPLVATYAKENHNYQIKDIMGQRYAVFDGCGSTFIPDSNNLGFKGTFYVLQNRQSLSAAHSLSSICRYAKQLVSIGVPTGLLSGRGTGPYFFQLKHSGFTFAMECDWDITEVVDTLDYYQDIPEIVLNFSLRESTRINFETSLVKSKKYLLYHDPYFKAVLHHQFSEKPS